MAAKRDIIAIGGSVRTELRKEADRLRHNANIIRKLLEERTEPAGD